MENNILNVTFNEFTKIEIEPLMKDHPEIHITLSEQEYKSLKKQNDLELKYAIANSSNRGSFKTFLIGVKWGWSIFRNSDFLKLRSLNKNINVKYPKSHHEKIELKLNEQNT